MNQRRKNVLITGGNFTNQGAYLMLCAAAEQVRLQFNAQPVIAMQTGTERAKRWVGLDSLLEFPRFGFRVWGGNPDKFSKVRHRLPFVVASEIDAVLDVSGFVFSDEWSHLNLRKRADQLVWWADRGVPTVLMPQAFGPFSRPDVLAPVSDLLDACSLAFARDPESAEFLESAARDSNARSRISLSTDFTTVLSPEHAGLRNDFAGKVPIVPNWNIARRAHDRGGSATKYVENLTEIAAVLRSEGYEVYGLCHEGGRDAEILNEVARKTPDFEVVEGLNGRQSKWLLGQAPFVVSGRFHAIVSSLSQGVPALAHGWSHKYRWLAEEYGTSRLALDPYSDKAQTRSVVTGLLAGLDSEREYLVDVVKEKKSETLAMWDKVGSVIFE